MNSKFTTTALAVSVAAGLASGVAQGAGFALIEQSASGMGNAFAGAAATAEDASTIFFNPAGLAKLKGSQFAASAHYISPKIDFSDNGSSRAPTIAAYSLGGNGGNAGSAVLVPNGYYSMALNDQWTMGVGVNAPFGFKTEYDSTWIGRFQGIKSDIKSVNINPSVAVNISDALSIGFGVSYQRLEAELTRKAATGFAGVEFNSALTADDTAWGYDFGVLARAGENTRIGVSYRSKLRYRLEGSVTVTSPVGGMPAAVAASRSGPSTADVIMPESLSLSVAHSISERTQLVADITRTRWSEIQSIYIVSSTTGAVRDTLALNFKDAYRYSIGVNHKCTDRFTAKVGLALDTSPVEDADRTVNLPDNDRTWFALGGKWSLSESAAIDLGYAHLFVKNAPIDFTRGSAVSSGRVAGDYSGKIDILSFQFTKSF